MNVILYLGGAKVMSFSELAVILLEIKKVCVCFHRFEGVKMTTLSWKKDVS